MEEKQRRSSSNHKLLLQVTPRNASRFMASAKVLIYKRPIIISQYYNTIPSQDL